MKTHDTHRNGRNDNTEIILDNMTQRYARLLNDLMENKRHSPSCICWLCLWREYETGKKAVGHPYDLFTFLIHDIISEIEDPHILSGRPSFHDEDIVNDRPLTKKLVKEVIRRLPFSSETRASLKKQYEKHYRLKNLEERNFETYYRLGRYHSDGFMELVSELIFSRQKKRMKSAKPIAIVKTSGISPGILSYKAAIYIYSQPGQRATQRDLQRHLNVQIIYLEYIRPWLKLNYGIEVKTEGRSVVYFATNKYEI